MPKCHKGEHPESKPRNEGDGKKLKSRRKLARKEIFEMRKIPEAAKILGLLKKWWKIKHQSPKIKFQNQSQF